MRRDLVIDGIALESATIEGDDATDHILSMYASFGRDDINCIMLDGLVISMYNVIDGERIAVESQTPVIAITFDDSKGLEDNIKERFQNWEFKLEQYKKLGVRQQVVLKTGKSLFVRCWGLSQQMAISILNSFTIQGAIPEPIRVAKLFARACNSNALN